LRALLLIVLTACLLLAVEWWLALILAPWLAPFLVLMLVGREAKLFGGVASETVYVIFLLLTIFGLLVLRTLLWTI
jgi:hypothetical protein